MGAEMIHMRFLFLCINVVCCSMLCIPELQPVDKPYIAHKELCAIKPKEPCSDLNQTAEFILAMIQGNSINLLLEHENHSTVDLLLKNMSPAQIAFQAEVINCDQPVILVCYDPHFEKWNDMKQVLIHHNKTSSNSYKMVCADVTQLFSIAQLVSLVEIPTFILYYNGIENNRLSDIESLEQIEQWLTAVLYELSEIKEGSL